MIARSDEGESGRKLADLRKAQPADTTLRNLLGVVSSKLDLCARLPVYEWEAADEGYARSADAFHRLAELEQESFWHVLDSLRAHLEHVAPIGGGGRP